MEARWADIDGPVFYQEWPGVPSRTFVLLHGLGGNHANWSTVAGGLSRYGRVLVPDLVGSGLTPRAGRSSSVTANTRLVGRFVREIAGSPVVLCGNSLGGSIALLEAACEPDWVLGAALNGAALPPPHGELVAPVVYFGTALYTLPVVGGALGWLRVKALPPDTLIRLGFRIVIGDPAAVPEAVVEEHVRLARVANADADSVPAFVETTASILSLMQRPDIARRYLRSVRCPVLLMHGDRDRVVPMRPTLAAAPDGWDRRVFPGLGHVFQLEAPEVWLETVTGWIEANGF